MKNQEVTVDYGRSNLLNRLWDFQNEKGYISDEDVAVCSQEFGLSNVEIEGVLSFYHFYSRKPRGKYTVYLNNSIVSEIKGYHRIREAFEKETGSTFANPEVTDLFGLYETPCIGLSDQEPAALINFHPFTNLNSLKVRDIVAKLRKGVPVEDIADDVPDNIRSVPKDDKVVFFRQYYPGIALEKVRKMSRDKALEEITESGLLGMGGAFFPVGAKWRMCKEQRSTPKYIVCNADEGEPGTFKDRVLLNSLPGLMYEGITIAGYIVGATEGIIYLRAEYRWMLDRLNKVLEQFRRMHLLGENAAGIEGFNFDIRIQLGAGSYVCGEETALLNSLEGKRGEARIKQFFPAQRGYMDQPTVVNNVETFCAAARVIEFGAEKFKTMGTERSPGNKILSVSGDCHQPGIYEVEFGTPIGDVIKMAQADDPYFIQISGPSGECIGSDELDRRLGVEDLRCGGSVMIFNRNRDILHILSNFAEFFKIESCGVCTPCRAGNFIICHKLEKMQHGLASKRDFEEIRQWGEIMKTTSRCGLGKAATRALTMAMDKFKSDLKGKAHRATSKYNVSFDLAEAVREYEQFKN